MFSEPEFQPKPFRLFDELEDEMTRVGSLYLGPDFRGRYVVATCGNHAHILDQYIFQALAQALRTAGYREGEEADDTDAAFYLADVGLWCSSLDMILVGEEQTQCLAFARAYLADQLHPQAVFELDEYWDFQVLKARERWEGLDNVSRREISASQLDGHRYTKWSSAYAHANYHELVDYILED